MQKPCYASCIWTPTNISRYVNTNEQIPHILTMGSSFSASQWNDSMQLVQPTSTPFEKASVCSHSLSRLLCPPKTILFWVISSVSGGGSQLELGDQFGKRAYTTPNTTAFASKNPPNGERSRRVNTLSCERHVVTARKKWPHMQQDSNLAVAVCAVLDRNIRGKTTSSSLFLIVRTESGANSLL